MMFPVFLTVVFVVRDQAPGLERLLSEAAAEIAAIASDYELVIIDNASRDDSVAVLQWLTGENGLANLQVYALSKEVDLDTAAWVGLENALGDYIAVIDPLCDDIGFLPTMLEQAMNGAEAVFACNRQKPPQDPAYRLAHAFFNAPYRSTNIGEIEGRTFERVVCAGAPAQKWLANRAPEADRRDIEALLAHLETVRCRRFVLISTVDVFGNPSGVDEDSPVDASGLHPYGLHRRLEAFVERRLVGPGLRKNVILDLLHDNHLAAIGSRGVFQRYPMGNLWYDLRTALAAGLTLLHLAAPPARYDLQTRHARLSGAAGRYQYSARESLQAIRAYAQSEPLARTSATEAKA